MLSIKKSLIPLILLPFIGMTKETAVQEVSVEAFQANISALVEQMQDCKKQLKPVEEISFNERDAASCVTQVYDKIDELKPQISYTISQRKKQAYSEQEEKAVESAITDFKKNFKPLTTWAKELETFYKNTEVQAVPVVTFVKNVNWLNKKMQTCEKNMTQEDTEKTKKCIDDAFAKLQLLKPQLRHVHAQLDNYNKTDTTNVTNIIKTMKSHTDTLQKWYNSNP